MELHNIRRGFATNSSSSHSFVYLDGHGGKPEFGEKFFAEAEEYAWQDFELDTLSEKLNYALVQLVGWKNGEVEELYERYGHLFPEYSLEDFVRASEGDVDHESRTGNIQKVVDLARDPKVIITGGNDNESPTSARYMADPDNFWDGEPMAGVDKIESVG